MAKDDFQYNNEEEAEMAQLHSIHINDNAVAKFRSKLAEQASQPSLSHCGECGEDIPLARQKAVLGCTTCIECQSANERRR